MLIVLLTTFNNGLYLERCLKSLLSQEYKNWKCYIVDDASTDNSISIIMSIAGANPKLILTQNSQRQYQVANYWQIMASSDIQSNDICLTLDGDDWLPDSNVFDRLNEVYTDSTTWLTWGGMKSLSGTRTYNPSLDDVFRLKHIPFHLRTWRASLWQCVTCNDLKDDQGEFFKVAGDLAFMLPMLKFAKQEHCKSITEFNYCYNDLNCSCNHFTKREEQIFNERAIRKKHGHYMRRIPMV